MKALGLDPETLSEEDMIRHMLDEPRLIRRPLLTAGTALTVGFDKDQLLSTLST
ncbi:ArsC family protein [compost metagenome]